MPRKEITASRRLRTSVPREVKRLLKFANAELPIAGEDAAIRRDFRQWLHRLAAGEQLPSHVIHPPYVGVLGDDPRTASDWMIYRRALTWLATTPGLTLLRECPNPCQKFFVIEPGGRRTRKFCGDCAR